MTFTLDELSDYLWESGIEYDHVEIADSCSELLINLDFGELHIKYLWDDAEDWVIDQDDLRVFHSEGDLLVSELDIPSDYGPKEVVEDIVKYFFE